MVCEFYAVFSIHHQNIHFFIFFNLYIPFKFYILKLATTEFSYCFNILCPYEMLYIYICLNCKNSTANVEVLYLWETWEYGLQYIKIVTLHHLYINSKDTFTLIKCCILCLFWIISELMIWYFSFLKTIFNPISIYAKQESAFSHLASPWVTISWLLHSTQVTKFN